MTDAPAPERQPDLTERITATDGGEFGAALRRPASGRGPGMLLVHEIFGANAFMASVAERLAVLGYVALLPDLYWRIQPGTALTDDDVNTGIQLGAQLDVEAAVSDLGAALSHLRGLPGVDGGTGVLGFCLGGSLAYLLAAAADPDVAVSYYGSQVPDALDRMGEIACPILFHFGGDDPFIPRERVDRVGAAAAEHEGAVLHVWEGAGHAFDNQASERFFRPAPAVAAWGVTAVFLARHLPAT